MVVSDLLVLSGPRWCFGHSNTRHHSLSLFWWNGNFCSALREDEVQQSQTALSASVALCFIKCIHVFTDQKQWNINVFHIPQLCCTASVFSFRPYLESSTWTHGFVLSSVWLPLSVYCAKTSLGSFELMCLWCSKMLLYWLLHSSGVIQCWALKIRLMSNTRPLST